MNEFSPMRKSAVISECGTYRYRLRREWNDGLRLAAFVMLNPSTADAETDDPTIRRCIAFASRWNCGGIEVVNLFAYRATDPSALKRAADPVGPGNDNYIRSAAEHCWPVIAAWGVNGVLKGRDRDVEGVLDLVGMNVKCLGVTKDGHPRHPLYVRADTEPMAFPLRIKHKPQERAA